jgi:V-type H+-transporting ATPase subunit F
VEEFFKKLTSREDVAIVLINQSVANDIRHLIREYTKMIPTILEIPSKDQAYDPDQDYIMQRVNMIMGAQT